MTVIWQDIKYALRGFAKTPGMTMIAVAILALGIGANVTMFGFVNTYLLRSLPFADADRLVALQGMDVKGGEPYSVYYADFLDWQQQNQSFESLACYHDGDITLNGPGTPEKLRVMHASADLLPMLGVQPVVGRLFSNEDDKPQATKTVLLSYGLWQRRFGAQPEVVGQSIQLDGESVAVVGVLPASFAFPPWSPDQGDLLQPLSPWVEMPGNRWFKNRGNSASTGAIGKLKAGVTLAEAGVDMEKIAAQLREHYPDTNRTEGIYLARFQDYRVGDVKPLILLLSAAVAFVLLMVCINLANLMLVRASARWQEFSVRCALGACRRHIIGQILVDSAVLVILGGLLGSLLAWWSSQMLVGFLPTHLQSQGHMVTLFNGPNCLFVLGLMGVTTLISSLASILHLSRNDLAGQIRSQSRSATTSRHGQRLRDSLVVAEMALAMVLLVGAGLMLNSFIHYLKTDPGYNPEHVISLRLSLPQQTQRREAFCTQLLEQVSNLAGVKHAGLSSSLLESHATRTHYQVEGIEPDQSYIVRFFEVSPGFFSTMGMRLVQGRLLNEQDMIEKRNVAIINQTFADRWWPNGNALGQRIGIHNNWMEVVGVVNPVKHEGQDGEPYVCLYYTGYRWWPVGDDRTLVVRTQKNPTQIVAPIRRIVTELDTGVPIFQVRTLHEIATEQSRLRRISTGILSGFAVIALLLAVLGIYGVLATSVTQRTQEMGIRLALGARVGHILRTVLIHGLKLTTIGLVLGLLGSLALSRLIESHLFGVTAQDPITFIVVASILTGAALLACYIPSRRAAKIDPMEALRYE